MLGGWRGIDGYGGEEGKDLVGTLDGLKVGFSNDWKAYEGEKKAMCDGQPRTTFLTLTLTLTPTLTDDRLRAVFVPDVPWQRLARVERESNISLVVRSSPLLGLEIGQGLGLGLGSGSRP